MQDISDCLSPEAQNVAEARLAAKRAARAEAREIRMKELERQQKEVEERPDKDFAEKSGRPVSSLSAATLASLGGTSLRRGSGDTSISVDTEASIREIKDSLAEVEEKYKRSMVTSAQLDNEKTSLQYQVDTVREVLLELEEELAETRRHYEDKQKECERQKHEQGVLRFQLAEMKEALEQREALLTKHGITLDSDSTLNGDTPIEHHVNSDGPPDPPVRAVSMGKKQEEGTVERKEAMSVVGECPPSGTGQDSQETAQEPQKENLHAEGGDVSSEHNEEKNNSNTIVEIVPVDVCSHHKSETSMDEQKDEMSCGIREDEEMSESEAVENLSEVDDETKLKRSDVSPSGSEVFQDAIDYVDETPSTTSEFDQVTGCVSDCEKEEPKNNQVENLTKADVQCTMGGAPEDEAEISNGHTVNICKSDESNVLNLEQDSNNSSSSHEEIRAETSENITSSKNIDLEHEVPVEDDLKPQQSLQQESGSQTIEENMDQNKNDAILSAAENSGDIDQSKIVSAPEQPSPDAPLTSDDFAARVENFKSSDISESCVDTEMKNITEDEPIKDHVIPKDSGNQNEYEHAPENERPGDVLLESEDLKVEDQREEDTLSHDVVCGNTQNESDATANKAESPKEIVLPEVFSSEGESTQEDEETDDENGTIRSEKYTGESEIPCSLLGSSVDRQSLEDIRMEDASEKSPRRGKGKNKEDCVVS